MGRHVRMVRKLLGMSPDELAEEIGLGAEGGEEIERMEAEADVYAPVSLALTYLAQGALAERSGIPEYLVSHTHLADGVATFVTRMWRPRFIAMEHRSHELPPNSLPAVWVEEGKRCLVILQWWDTPYQSDPVTLLHDAKLALEQQTLSGRYVGA